MAIEVKIQVRNEKIQVDAPQSGFHQEFKNTLATIPNGSVVAIGQSLAELIRENPHNEEKFREDLKFLPIYAVSEKGLQNLLFFLEFIAIKLRKGRGMFSRLSASNSLVLQIELPNYENMDILSRQQFEFTATKFIVNGLTINGETKGWGKWQRRVLEISRPVFLLLWPLLWYFFVLFVAPLTESLGVLRWAFYRAGLFLICYGVAFLRMFVLRQILPIDLLKSELLNPRMGNGKFGDWVVDKFLTDGTQ